MPSSPRAWNACVRWRSSARHWAAPLSATAARSAPRGVAWAARKASISGAERLRRPPATASKASCASATSPAESL